MLEKSLNIHYYDAHFHYSDCLKNNVFLENKLISGCSCVLSQEEWKINENLPSNYVKIYGIHPLYVNSFNLEEELSFAENLLMNKLISGIGEIGFDFFNSKDKENSIQQESFFSAFLNLAIKYNVPVVIHCRKANEKLFEYSNKLKLLPSVIFHSFMGNSIEAEAFLNKGINGFFSFGKQIMNNNKKVLNCITNLPLERLLLETDAPFQKLKNETFTSSQDIISIYEAFKQIREEKNNDFVRIFKNNFNMIFKTN